jgi:predicted DNA-binding transcriptional regulator AlpA
MRSNGTLLTPEELAERLQMKRGWVYRHARKLGAYHLGKYLRFSWPKVIEAMEHFEFVDNGAREEKQP